VDVGQVADDQNRARHGNGPAQPPRA
jgi:hypothetical protein